MLARAREGDADYLDAVVKEALRIRPVIPGVGRVVRGEPFRARRVGDPARGGDQPVDPGHPPARGPVSRPAAFRPERFLGPDAPDTYTWIPFGGGTRRCLGASFAQMEMRIVLRRVLERCTLRPADPKVARSCSGGSPEAPSNGALAIADRAPRAATGP